MKHFIRAGLAGLTLLAGAPAFALDMRISGNTITLSGSINNGDEATFREHLDSPAGKNVRIVRLNSGGGWIFPAGEIGRLVRKRGLSTYFDVSGSKCASACILIFGGGVNRHYVNGQGIKDGISEPGQSRGLAFHEAWNPISRHTNKYAPQATGEIIGYYYEFGISAAAKLITQAPPNKLYQISGPTALSLGIATSLARP